MLGLAEVVGEKMEEDGDEGGGHVGGVDDGWDADPSGFCCACRNNNKLFVFAWLNSSKLNAWHGTAQHGTHPAYISAF